ncbi:MAG: chemotaxis protein, partial [Thermodesulfobacteriota bacterium]|nr:chemotaxis protein [Thermodesulfobacteriota bacterium]
APHPCFLGTISLRKLIVPVLDLAVWLGMERQKHGHEIVIVTEFSHAITGFLVSGVTNIHRVGWEQVAPPHEYIAGMDVGSIVGVVDMGDHFIQLLDLEHILSDLDPESMEKAGETEVKAGRQYKALVADDSPTIRLMLKKNLEASNFKPWFTKNGREALDLIQEFRKQAGEENKDITDFVDIVIADIEMPLMDGFTLTKNIKEDQTLQKLPVILYSSIITKELRHKGESVKADEQISKPEMDRMAERAIRLLEAR